MPEQTFTWTREASSTELARLERDAERISRAIELDCRRLFPRRAGYRVSTDQLEGMIRGRRYRISRRGFVGQVSVLLLAGPGGYRQCPSAPLRLRVSGGLHTEPPPPPPAFPTEALTLGALIFALASTAVGLGYRGWWEITQNASNSRFIDAVGLLGAAWLVVLASTVAVLMLRHGVDLPWAHLRHRLRRPANAAADRTRWSALRLRMLAHAPVRGPDPRDGSHDLVPRGRPPHPEI